MPSTPKRKRPGPITCSSAPAHTVEIESSSEALPQTAECNNTPRTQRVARRLSLLEIQATSSPEPDGRAYNSSSDTSVDSSPRKRQKRVSPDPALRRLQLRPKAPNATDMRFKPLVLSTSVKATGSGTVGIEVVGEEHVSQDEGSTRKKAQTTGCRTPSLSPRQQPVLLAADPKPEQKQVSPLVLNAVLPLYRPPSPMAPARAALDSTLEAHPGPTSEPISVQASPTSPLLVGILPSSPAPASSTTPPPPESENNFWAPSEITGHQIDADQPDDADGLGINGIGFAPTRAMIEDRRVKRGRAIKGWRERNEREDRERRIEGRRNRGGLVERRKGMNPASVDTGGVKWEGVGSGAVGVGQKERRTVRFAVEADGAEGSDEG